MSNNGSIPPLFRPVNIFSCKFSREELNPADPSVKICPFQNNPVPVVCRPQNYSGRAEAEDSLPLSLFAHTGQRKPCRTPAVWHTLD